MIVSPLDKESYKKFYETQKNTFFNSPEWYEILFKVYNVDAQYLGISREGELVAVLPVITRKMWGLSIYGAPLPQISTPVCLYPLLGPENVVDSEILEAIDHWITANNWKYMQLCWPIDGSPPAHVSVESRQIVEIDLEKPLAEIWGQIKREARNRIRYAVRSGIRVHLNMSDKFMDEYPRLLQCVYDFSQGIRPNTPPSLFKEVRKRLSMLPLKIFTATRNDRVVAMLWIFYDQDACYYWEGAADEVGKKYAANNLLHWEVIRWAHKQGLKRYDMVGASGRGGRRDGILRYKQSLGAQTRECKMLYWHKNMVVRVLFHGYRKYLATGLAPRSWRKERRC